MLLELTSGSIDWTIILTGVISLVSGGAILKLYEARNKNKSKERLDNTASEQDFVVLY